MGGICLVWDMSVVRVSDVDAGQNDRTLKWFSQRDDTNSERPARQSFSGKEAGKAMQRRWAVPIVQVS